MGPRSPRQEVWPASPDRRSFAFPLRSISGTFRPAVPMTAGLAPTQAAPTEARLRSRARDRPGSPSDSLRGAWMHEPKGRYLPLTGPRRFIGDLVHFAHKVPSAPVSRLFDVSPLVRPSGSASLPALVGLPFHEGLCPGRRPERPVAQVLSRVPLAPPLRAPLDELRPGHRADLPRRGGGLRRHLPGSGAAEPGPDPGRPVLVQERAAGTDRLLPPGPSLQSRAHAGAAHVLVGHAQHRPGTSGASGSAPSA